MKRKLNINLLFSRTGSFILLFVFAFGSAGASAPVQADLGFTNLQVISQYKAAQANSALSDEEKIKATIDAYFTLRYEGQKSLQMQDFSSLIDDNTQTWVKKEKNKRDIELYVATLFDLKYVNYKYMLNYDSVEIKNNKATVLLRESHEVVFEAIAPEPSRLSDLPHTLTLRNKQGAWVVYKDEYRDELSQEMDHVTKEDIKKLVDENYQEDLKNRSFTRQLGNKVLASPATRNLALTNHSYNRTAALNYADAHTSNATGTTNYNTAYYQTEPPDAGDCTNFVSQALYAGEGISPPNATGMAVAPRSYGFDWYYVFNSPSGTQNGSGSLPWIQVQKQYDFITAGTVRVGPYGYNGPFQETSNGDIVQISKSNNGVYDHEGIIVVIGLHTMSTTLVDAHTTNRWHYPLSNWATLSPRYIIIQGWKN